MMTLEMMLWDYLRDRVRAGEMSIGQAGYVHGNLMTYIQVKQLPQTRQQVKLIFEDKAEWEKFVDWSEK